MFDSKYIFSLNSAPHFRNSDPKQWLLAFGTNAERYKIEHIPCFALERFVRNSRNSWTKIKVSCANYSTIQVIKQGGCCNLYILRGWYCVLWYINFIRPKFQLSSTDSGVFSRVFNFYKDTINWHDILYRSFCSL